MERNNPFSKIEETDECPGVFIENGGLPYELSDNYHTIITAKSWAGKSNIISKLLNNYYIHRFKPQNIFIASPTFEYDKTYTPIRNYMKWKLQEEYKNHVKDHPDKTMFDKILKR